MKSKVRTIACGLLAVLVLSAGACSRKGGGVRLRTEADSLSYVIGMNVGWNLLRMDSTLNAEAVCQAIRDVFQAAPALSAEDAKAFYLRYVNFSKPEKIRAYEERFLEDFVRDNRSFARTKLGLTYAVEEIGDEQATPRADRDTVVIRYVGRTADGREFDSSYERGDSTRMAVGDLMKGLQESVKLIGKGGRIDAWVPAALAYGARGDAALGIKPNETLRYEIELIDVVRPSSTQGATVRHQARADF